MLTIKPVKQYRRDLRRMQRRNKDMAKLEHIITLLAQQQPLAPQHRDHPLSGNYQDTRECHIEPDWLLIYKIDGAAGKLRLIRTGAHADLF